MLDFTLLNQISTRLAAANNNLQQLVTSTTVLVNDAEASDQLALNSQLSAMSDQVTDLETRIGALKDLVTVNPATPAPLPVSTDPTTPAPVTTDPSATPATPATNPA